MAVLRVGDRVLYDGETWRVNSLGRHAPQSRGDRSGADGQLYAILLLEADSPEVQPPHKIVLPESKWAKARLLQE
jgi:hypothetical protein